RSAPIFVSGSARRTGVASGRATSRSAPARSGPASSPLFSVDLLERVDGHLSLGHHALELRVLGFKLPQPLHVRRVQLAEALAPAVQRLFADLVLAGDLGHRYAVGLPQDRHHLFFGESALSHGLLASGREPFSQLIRAPKIPGRSIWAPCKISQVFTSSQR